VAIPETVIIQRVPRPIPDPAAETAVIRGFLKYGITVVDLAHIRLLRATADGLAKTEDLARRALAGDSVAIRELAGRNGAAADILVVGEAVSTVEVLEALRIPGQPRVQDGRSRVEVRAIKVATGEFQGHEITVSVSGIETFGFRFGASPQDIARAVAKEIANQLAALER